MEKQKIDIIDLFSGYGGFSLGFEQAGFEIENHYYSEIDPHAIACYKHNFPHAKYLGSVNDIDGNAISNIDIVTFGFPCQDLSLAGKRLGFEGRRSILFYEATRILRETRAKVFVWENVMGLLSSNGGDDFIAVCEELYTSGYLFDVEEINSSWFVPQNRQRVFSVGFNIKHLFECLLDVNTQNGSLLISEKVMAGFLSQRLLNILTVPTKEYEQWLIESALLHVRDLSQSEMNGQNLKKIFLQLITRLEYPDLLHCYQNIQSNLSRAKKAPLNLLSKENQDITVTGTELDIDQSGSQGKELLLSIEMLLSSISEEDWLKESKFIILTLINSITTSQTYTFAEMQMYTDAYIILSSHLCPSLWNSALSFLTEKQKNTNYAKNRGVKKKSSNKNTNSDDLFQLPISNEVERDVVGHLAVANRGFREVFPIGESIIGINEGATDTATVRTLTAGGHSGGHHSGMTLIQEATNFQGKDIANTLRSGGKGSLTDKHNWDMVKVISHYGHKDKDAVVGEICPTLKAESHGHTPMVMVSSATKTGYEAATNGDSINLSMPNSKTRRGRVGKGVAQTLDTQCNQAVIQLNPSTESQGVQPYQQNRVYDANGISPALDQGAGRWSIKSVSSPDMLHKDQNGRRIKEDGDPMFTLTTWDKHGVEISNGEQVAIRRLTEVECERLQGLPDNWTKWGMYENKKTGELELKEISSTQRYKMCGNGVTVDVVEAIALKLKKYFA